jgi:hypothetical protein
VPDPYASLTPAELAAFLVLVLLVLLLMMMMRPTTTTSSGAASSLLALFPFWCLDDKGGEESYLYLYHFSF